MASTAVEFTTDTQQEQLQQLTLDVEQPVASTSSDSDSVMDLDLDAVADELPSDDDDDNELERWQQLIRCDVSPGHGVPSELPAYELRREMMARLFSSLEAQTDQVDRTLALSLPSSGEPETVDVVISGGGMKGYFVVGCYAILSRLNSLRVGRIAGASIGACCAVYWASGVGPVEWALTYYATNELVQRGESLVSAFAQVSSHILPDDAHIRCSGRVFISITLCTMSGPQNIIVSEFESKADLIEACLASATIPFFTVKRLGSFFRGQRVLDGGFTNNTPHFSDKPSRRQIVVRLFSIAYPSTLALNTEDSCAEALVIRGAMQMLLFFGDPTSRNDGISWYSTTSTSKYLMPASELRAALEAEEEKEKRILSSRSSRLRRRTWRFLQRGHEYSGMLSLLVLLVSTSAASTMSQLLATTVFRALATTRAFKLIRFVVYVLLFGGRLAPALGDV